MKYVKITIPTQRWGVMHLLTEGRTETLRAALRGHPQGDEVWLTAGVPRPSAEAATRGWPLLASEFDRLLAAGLI